MIKINAHGHLLPHQRDIPAFMREKEIFWLTEDESHMCQKGWSRPVTHPSFFIDEKIPWMETQNIDHEVLITLSQLYANGYNRHTTNDIIRFQNDFHAEIQATFPKKFTCGFVVQPAFTDDALKEMERCAGLGLRVMCLPTHFYNREEKWESAASEAVFPIFELADQLGLSIEFHPYDAEKMIALQDQYWRFHLIWMCAQTADTHHIFASLDIPNRYSGIRFCFAHGNQFGQIAYGRRLQAYKGRPDLFPGALSPEHNMVAPNVFYDTLVHDIWSLELLLKRQGAEQIVAGLDDPYPLGEMDGVAGSYPGKVLDDAENAGIISTKQKCAIWKENVESWLSFSIPINEL